MKNQVNTYPYFMSHPFWDALRIDNGTNALHGLQSLATHDLETLVCEAVKGFYPISYASLLAFKRFAEMADQPESRAIAWEIYQVEKGDKPLIEGSPLTGVPHCDQLKMMFESLLGTPMNMPAPEDFSVLQKADIPNASLTKAMAICDLIEHTAPFVIHFYQDFLIQCQVALRVPSELIQRSYLDEHNLTEGNACEAQHIDMLGRMMGHYNHLMHTEEYGAEQQAFIALVNEHFEQHRQRMLQLLPLSVAA